MLLLRAGLLALMEMEYFMDLAKAVPLSAHND